MKIKKGIALSVGTLLLLSIFLGGGMLIYEWSSDSNNPIITGKAIGETGVTGMSNQQTIKREEIKHALVSSFIEALKEIEANGGYAKGYVNEHYPSKSFDYSMNYVALYRACKENRYPSLEDIRQQLIARTQDYFNQKMEAYMQDDREFEFTGINSLNIRILDGKVQLIADLNARYKGYALPAEYFIEVPTNIKKIHEFATNFTEMMSKLRLVEFYMIHLLYSAEEHYLPTGGMLTECGDGISLSPRELTQRFNDLYGYLLANVDFFKPLDLDEEDPPHYNLILVGSDEHSLKDYKGLSIILRRPDDFALSFSQGVSVSNNEWLSTSPLNPLPECIRRYDFSYSFPMAYIVSVKDDLVGGEVTYNFAEYGFIENMVPSDDCGYDSLPDNTLVMSPSILDGIHDSPSTYSPPSVMDGSDCNSYSSQMAVWVRDRVTGRALADADVYFKGCYVGKTDDSGFIKVPYYSNNNDAVLSVAKQGYASYETIVSKYNPILRVYIDPLKERNVKLHYIYVHAHLTPKPQINTLYSIPTIDNPNYGYSIDLSSPFRGLLSRNALLWVDYCEIKDEIENGVYEGSITFSNDNVMSLDANTDIRSLVLSDANKFTTGTSFTTNEDSLSIALPTSNLYVDLMLYKPFVQLTETPSINDYKEISRVRYVMRGTSASQLNLYIPLIRLDDNRVSQSYEADGFLDTHAAALTRYRNNDALSIMSFYEQNMVDLIKNGCGMNLYGTQQYQRTYSVNTALPPKYVCKRLKTVAFACGDTSTYNALSNVNSCDMYDDDCCDISGIITNLRNQGCAIIEANTPFL